MNVTSPRFLQYIILALVIAGLFFMALGGYLRPASSWFQRLLVDAQTWFSERYLALVDFLTVPRDVLSLRQRNLELEAEVARLQSEVIFLRQQVAEVEVLSALLEFARANPEYSYVGAVVIGRDPSPFYQYVIIDVGSNRGILAGMPVVTDRGLVGRVDAVIAEAARVQLITDAASAINVRLQPSNVEAMLVGSPTGDLSLDMIPKGAAVEPGDIILTSGLGGVYPPNILVGQVSGVRRLEYELFQRASVQPNVDFARLQFVLVITNFKPVDITPLLTTPSP
ncbi:MAG: rod shape-determining protein MreC [Anaerolineales bacterium]|nr:rod shape-determining protein MreC [Anaerolineales bacterium]